MEQRKACRAVAVWRVVGVVVFILATFGFFAAATRERKSLPFGETVIVVGGPDAAGMAFMFLCAVGGVLLAVWAHRALNRD